MVVRLGAIGIGGGLATLELGQYAAMDDVEIVAGCDVSEEYRSAFESEYGAPSYETPEALLAAHGETLDAASIVTPHTLHYEQARACLEAGLDVFVEKPMVTDSQQGGDLIRLARDRDLVVQVGYQRHFHPAFTEIKRVIDSGRIGDVHTVSTFLAQNWIDPFEDEWRTDPSLSGGGQLYDSGSHLLDTVLWTTDAEPVSVAGVMDQYRDGVDVNTAISMLLERDDQESPITASVSVSGDGVNGAPDEALHIWGTEGAINYTQNQGNRITVTEESGREYVSEVTEDVTQPPLTRKKLTNFVSAVKGKAEPAVPGEYGLRVTALTEAVYQAHETGETVDVRGILDSVQQQSTAQSPD